MTNANGKDSEASCHMSINFIYPVRGTLKKLKHMAIFCQENLKIFLINIVWHLP